MEQELEVGSDGKPRRDLPAAVDLGRVLVPEARAEGVVIGLCFRSSATAWPYWGSERLYRGSAASPRTPVFTVMEMDLDDFESINDQFGRHSGDRLLQEVGRILTAQMRDSDIVVRYAEDEFIAVLPKTTLEHARQSSFRVQEAVEGVAIDAGGGTTLSAKMSIGLASFPTHGTDFESLLRAADKNLREQKNHRKSEHPPDPPYPTDPRQPRLFSNDD